MQSLRTALALALLAGAGWAADAARAQGALPLDVEQVGVSYHSFARAGEVQVEVLVLGDVRVPGVYAVGIGIRPDELLALAGGPVATSQSERVETTVTVQVFREGPAGRTLAEEQLLEQFLTAPPPPLEAGDALVVDVEEEERQRTLDIALRVLTAASTVFLVIERLLR